MSSGLVIRPIELPSKRYKIRCAILSSKTEVKADWFAHFCSNKNIDIFIAFALDESVILDVLQFPLIKHLPVM